ncbi:hypothetical protein EDD21DRAFT_165045 [Dissophora ornata]|nr:hypothetical protein EDD21DRAFT_165045 [Dissophora ornata]
MRTIKQMYMSNSRDYELTNAVGSKFFLTSYTEFILSENTLVMRVSMVNQRDDDSETDLRRFDAPIGPTFGVHDTFFIPETSQLGVVTNGSLSLWTLSAKPGAPFCRLTSIWKFQKARDVISVESCQHGKNLKIVLSLDKGGEDTLVVPISPEDMVSISPKDTHPNKEEYHLNQGFVELIDIYAQGSESCKQAIIRYLKARIRQSRERSSISPLNSICEAWTQDRRPFVESIISRLLPVDRITWVPDIYANKKDNPLFFNLKVAETNASALKVTRIIMDYCFAHAQRSRNFAFLSPLFGALHERMGISSAEVFERLGRIAYVPAMHQSYVLSHSTIARPPQFRLQFWKSSEEPLYKMDDPILQLDGTVQGSDPDNVKFTKPIFVASFDALWYYKDDKTLKGPDSDPLVEATTVHTTTWWKTLYHMIRLKCRLRIHSYVETYDFSIEFYDNPAIAALVAYKWNTIGFWYWSVRFFSQCCFYALVIIASIMQVYYPQPSRLLGLFVAIIVMAAIFIWLELLQAVRSFGRYTNSGYNFLDILAFSLPMAASIDQIVVISQGDTHGNTRLLSFSVLAVFLHMLFELRISRSVCKYVTIIQGAVYEIRVFFIIFAGGILAFAIATLHLLRSCPYEGCDPPTSGFSSNFIGALFDTYFFMGGIWDPVSDDFVNNEFGFQLMMALFFFFTVILMLNVLIALINVAFADGDGGWRLVWIESRLRYIESAENMSYHIPGFRQTYNYFPREIYFSATAKQVHEHRKKYHAKDRATEDLDAMEEQLARPTAADDDQADDDYLFEGEEVDESVAGKGLDSERTDTLSKADGQDGATVDVPKDPSLLQQQPSSEEQGTVGKLNSQVGELNSQVGDLKSQVLLLQTQLSNQAKTQQEQFTIQQEQVQKQFEELKNLLLIRSSTA